jgi:hypothetical protein
LNAGGVVTSYCQGNLTVNGNDGTVSFHATQTSDPGGRLDNFSVPRSDITKAELKRGFLHLEINGLGNFDFYGPGVVQALQAIRELK